MTCPTCAILRRERDELAERLRQIEEAGVSVDALVLTIQAKLKVSRLPARVLAALLTLHQATKDQLFDAVYGADPNGGPQGNIVSVMIVKLRHALSPHGVEITTHWGSGYSLSAEMKAKVRALIGAGA